MTTRSLSVSKSTTLAVVGGVVTGTVTLGPDQAAGPATWLIDGVILQTSRPGLAPVPRAQVFRGEATPANSQGLSYDGSFTQGPCRISLTRGELLIVVWTGGTAGDVATATLTGTKS